MLSFFNFHSIKNIVICTLMLAIAATILYMQVTIKSLKNELIILETNNSQLTSAIATQTNTITFLRTQAKLIEQEYRDIEKAFISARQEAETLKNTIIAKDIDNMSANYPMIAETTINNTTSSMYRCFELMSGSPLNEKEIAAKNAQEFNYMCAWYYNP